MCIRDRFRDRENGLCGGACRDSAQISRHLEKADTETLVDELMELTERAANGDVNLEQIDAYLDALDEKDPLPFKADSKAAPVSYTHLDVYKRQAILQIPCQVRPLLQQVVNGPAQRRFRRGFRLHLICP